VRPYKNLAGDSGVAAYECGGDWIAVRFRSGDTYRYTYGSAGRNRIERMKALAEKGAGLSTFISKHAADAYDAKW
jgi:hypothetical protein